MTAVTPASSTTAAPLPLPWDVGADRLRNCRKTRRKRPPNTNTQVKEGQEGYQGGHHEGGNSRGQGVSTAAGR
jgi:hypothetical protein